MNLLVLLAACTSAPPVIEPDPVRCDGDDGGAVAITIAPYLQAVTPEAAWILWETDAGVGSRVDFGPTPELGRAACGDLVPAMPGGDPADAPTQVHEVRLTGLEPGTTYHYRVATGATSGEVHHFRTPPPPGSAGPFRLVAMGDSQHDRARMDKHREVVHDGVIAHVHEQFGPDLSEELGLVLHAGDLVENGWVVDQWRDEFFAPIAPLIAQVPLYPVPGNHEGNSPHYFRYFHLPGDSGEHWYTTDYANLRIIGLDSNPPFDNAAQLGWLDGVLTRACADDGVDFVFAQLHHPHLSELWPHGESDFTGEVIARLEAMSTACGKPSIHFFGHTHGYARGQSRDHAHLWVNVASAGGALDRWGSDDQVNYDEISVSQDTWGFVLVEVEGGDDPRFRLERVSRGNDDAPEDNAITDVFTVHRYGAPPEAPAPIGDAPSACDGPVLLAASAFSDPDGQAHQASRWQVAADCDGFASPLVERWRQRRDVYQGEDLQAGDDLTDEPFPELAAGDTFCWRVRYRDDGLAWSAWSAPQAVALPGCG